MKNIKFIRFGGLSSVNQEHYTTKNKPYHNPPVRRGIYAFPYGHIDMFLLGATNHPTQPHSKTSWLKDENGNLIEFDKELTYVYTNARDVLVPSPKLKKILKLRNIKLSNISSARKSIERYKCPFELSDDYCCNLCDVEKECKTHNKSYIIYFIKPKIFEYKGEIWSHFEDVAIHGEVIQRSGSWIKTTYYDYCQLFDKTKHKDMKYYMSFSYNSKNMEIKDNNPYRKGGFNIAVDHLEVFIEKV